MKSGKRVSEREATVWVAHSSQGGPEVLDHAERRPLTLALAVYDRYAGDLESILRANAAGERGVVQYVELSSGGAVLARRELRS